MTTALDIYSTEELEGMLSRITEQRRAGKAKEKIISELGLNPNHADELMELAISRITGMEKFSQAGVMFMSAEDLRFATPENVAAYRAGRMASETIADLGCGIGGQSIQFAKHCTKVISIDRDERKVRYAQENARALGAKNITFAVADITSPAAAARTKGAVNVFCDPSRAAESGERKIDEITPAIPEILSLYRHASGIAFELPPQLHVPDVLLNCEREYLSIGGKLNRLTIYFGTLKERELSVVSLPSLKRVSSGKKIFITESKPLAYIHIVDTGIIHAELLPELVHSLGIEVHLLKQDKATLLTSAEPITDPFLKSFTLVKKVKNTRRDIMKALQDAGAGTVVLRARIEPERYWRMRSRFEKGLTGEKKIQLFIIDDMALLCS